MMGGDMNGGGSSAATIAAAQAEPQYAKAKTSVWWDIENCQVPRWCDSHAIAQNISSALIKMNYCGPVSISAYGDTTRIPSSVQQALSSTGIALNHVPAGVKDASDKKILVDMLFWAVDNPAPANFMLISGDRDFSNALHQLRMRRYNILLAQPQKASAPLIAAAKSVWLWTSLSTGGPPLTSGESSHLANTSHNFNPEATQYPVSEPFQNQSPVYNESLSLGNQKSSTNGRVGDTKYKGKQNRKNPNQTNLSRVSSMPGNHENPYQNESITSRASSVLIGVAESMNNDYRYHPEHTHAKQREYFSSNEPTGSGSRPTMPGFFTGNSSSSGNNLVRKPENFYPPRSRPNEPHIVSTFGSDNLHPPNSNQGFRANHPRPNGPRFSAPQFTNVCDVGKLSVSDFNNYVPNPPANLNVPQKGHNIHGGQASLQDAVRYPRSSEYKSLTPPSHTVTNNVSSDATLGTQESSLSPEYVHGLIGVVLIALNTLKVERIMPTEANIADCVQCGDPKHRLIDVRKALDYAIENNMVLKQNLGTLQFYVGKNDKLWKCVNPLCGNSTDYPKTTWDRIQKFLTSSAGRSAILASQCRYEAALILKKKCLKEHSLGNVLQVLNMIISMKKWITHHQSGWQPISIILPETKLT